jgi:energy-converting hydrogenase B subunit D
MPINLMFDGLLVVLILVLASGALFSTNIFKSIVLFISLGLAVTIAWIRLNAIDVAIAEVTIGAGLTGALLLGAWKRLEIKKRLQNPITITETEND